MSGYGRRKRRENLEKIRACHSTPDLNLHAPARAGLQLPFKPFTREEVESVTQAPSSVVDALWGRVLPERAGDVGFTPGMDFMQCFAVFVASRWLHEGAGTERAVGVAVFVANLGHWVMLEEFDLGNDFPAPTPQGGILVPHTDSPLGNRLNLRVLNEEFRVRLDQVFGQEVKSTSTGMQ